MPLVNKNIKELPIIAIIPAAGVGKRMGSVVPKQYLKINQKTIIEHTLIKLLQVERIQQIIIAVSENDPYIEQIIQPYQERVKLVLGGEQRADSVLAGLKAIQTKHAWALVHDAARPCVLTSDINKLIDQCFTTNCGGILAAPVSDTMKRDNGQSQIQHTEQRAGMWHAFTPQLFRVEQITHAIQSALQQNIEITDEASAVEQINEPVHLVESSQCNIKITRPDDLALAEFFINHQSKTIETQIPNINSL